MKNICLIATIVVLCSCKHREPANVSSPGDEKTSKTKVLEVGAAVLQDKTPIKQLEIYLDGFHFANGDMKMQMEAHHYCTKLNEEVTQCIMYDGNTKDARIIGIEYIISERLFKTLPDEEKRLWHSHVYEVKSGQLIAPGLPEVAEKELMEEIVSTYGKTIHTWHTSNNFALPVGIPLIMMGFTKDGQLSDSLLDARDKVFNVSTSNKKKKRADIPSPIIQPGANAWERKEIYQLQLDKK
jgi:hypothetical protein